MDTKIEKSPIDRLKDAGLDDKFINQTGQTFDHWRQTLAAIDDHDLGQDDLNTIYKRHVQS